MGKQAENEILQALAIYEIPTECECITKIDRQLSELLNILSRYAGRGQEPPFLSLTDPGKDSLQLLQIEEPWGWVGGRIATKAGRKFGKRYLEFVELPENMEAWMHAFFLNI